ncbi:hypothetical protein [Streptomyces cadmiisoli]|uniref:hypothetical protein n=1 Tax=Streptomyces cadmiisoli TaxID=2184053 RepID=UPI003D76413F
MRTGKYGISGWLVRRAAWCGRAVLVDVAVGMVLSGYLAAFSSYGYCAPLLSRCCSPRFRQGLKRVIRVCVAVVASRNAR